jgi:hypothetical protein
VSGKTIEPDTGDRVRLTQARRTVVQFVTAVVEKTDGPSDWWDANAIGLLLRSARLIHPLADPVEAGAELIEELADAGFFEPVPDQAHQFRVIPRRLPRKA